VHDERDDGKEQKQMDEEAADVHQGETAEPQDDQNNCEDKKHGGRLLSCIKDSRLARRLLLMREEGGGWSCLAKGDKAL